MSTASVDTVALLDRGEVGLGLTNSLGTLGAALVAVFAVDRLGTGAGRRVTERLGVDESPLLVARGATVGAPLRFLVGHALDLRLHWGTLVANLAGSATLGALVGSPSRVTGWHYSAPVSASADHLLGVHRPVGPGWPEARDGVRRGHGCRPPGRRDPGHLLATALT